MSMADIYDMESPLIFPPLGGGSIRLAYRHVHIFILFHGWIMPELRPVMRRGHIMLTSLSPLALVLTLRYRGKMI